MQRHLDRELPPGLYLVATPIGNLADITLRALSVLARADIILCEDTRHSRTLLSHFGIEATTRPYHDHNAARERPRVLADLAAGRRVALISRCRHAARLRPRLQARAREPRGRAPGRGAPRPVGRACGLERCRAADGCVLLCRLPAAEERGAALAHRRAQIRSGNARLLRSAIARSRDAGRSRRRARGAPAALARELTKLHEEVLRGEPAAARRAARRQAHQGRGRHRRRPCRRRARSPTRRSPRSSTRHCAR